MLDWFSSGMIALPLLKMKEEIRNATEGIGKGMEGGDANGGKRRTSGISDIDAIAGGGVLGLESLKP